MDSFHTFIMPSHFVVSILIWKSRYLYALSLSWQRIPNYVKQYACMINCMFIYLNFWLWFYTCLSPHLIAIQVPTALPLKPSNTSAVFISKSPVLNIPPRTRTAPLVWFIPIWVTTILQVHNWSCPLKCTQLLGTVLLCVVFICSSYFHWCSMPWIAGKTNSKLLSCWAQNGEYKTSGPSIPQCPFGLTLGVPNHCESAHGLYITINKLIKGIPVSWHTNIPTASNSY